MSQRNYMTLAETHLADENCHFPQLIPFGCVMELRELDNFVTVHGVTIRELRPTDPIYDQPLIDIVNATTFGTTVFFMPGTEFREYKWVFRQGYGIPSVMESNVQKNLSSLWLCRARISIEELNIPTDGGFPISLWLNHVFGIEARFFLKLRTLDFAGNLQELVAEELIADPTYDDKVIAELRRRIKSGDLIAFVVPSGDINREYLANWIDGYLLDGNYNDYLMLLNRLMYIKSLREYDEKNFQEVMSQVVIEVLKSMESERIESLQKDGIPFKPQYDEIVQKGLELFLRLSYLRASAISRGHIDSMSMHNVLPVQSERVPIDLRTSDPVPCAKFIELLQRWCDENDDQIDTVWSGLKDKIKSKINKIRQLEDNSSEVYPNRKYIPRMGREPSGYQRAYTPPDQILDDRFSYDFDPELLAERYSLDPDYVHGDLGFYVQLCQLGHITPNDFEDLTGLQWDNIEC